MPIRIPPSPLPPALRSRGRSVSVRIPESIFDDLRHAAVQDGRTTTGWIISAIRMKLESKNDGPARTA